MLSEVLGVQQKQKDTDLALRQHSLEREIGMNKCLREVAITAGE